MARSDAAIMIDEDSDSEPVRSRRLRSPMEVLLGLLASLKLTVVLLLMGIFIVFVGTLAQVDRDIWEVINEYFRTTNGKSIVWINTNVFFPPAFFPEGGPTTQFLIPFPKGWIIGMAMMVNLFAAHLLRFKIQGKGSMLGTGWGVTAAGLVLTGLLIYSGGIEKLQDYKLVWRLSGLALLVGSGLTIYLSAVMTESVVKRGMLGALAAILGAAGIYALRNPPLDPAAMRILFQLSEASLAALVLLAGCIMVFGKRGGIVLIHAGVMLIMANEVLVGVTHRESRMQIQEGETVNYSSDIRTAELAIVKPEKNEDLVTVIPASRLRNAALGKSGESISDELLPFDLRVLTYLENSTVRNKKALAGEKNIPDNASTVGIGTDFSLIPVEKVAGTDTGGQVDIPGAYIEFLDKGAGKSLGTLLLTPNFETSQPITVNGENYDIEFRFQRIYHDFSITLNDVQKNDYKGTSNPRDYSSMVKVEAPNDDFTQRVWMNNPMRYAGLTFYQSSYVAAGLMGRGSREATVLQVVENNGWMAPYIACMMVAIGMIAHFAGTLVRFLDRLDRQRTTDGSNPAGKTANRHRIQFGDFLFDPATYGGNPGIAGLAAGTIIFLLVFGSIWLKSRIPAASTTQFDVAAFGELPMWYKGRAMPIEAFARSTLQQLSDRQVYQPPSAAWVLELSGPQEGVDAHAAELETIRSSLKIEPGDLGYEVPTAWAEEVLPEGEQHPIDVITSRIVVAGDSPVKFQIRRHNFFASDFEGYSEGQINPWRQRVGLPEINSYSWRSNMRADGQLVETEFKVEEAPKKPTPWKRQDIKLTGNGSAVIATLLTPQKNVPKQSATQWLLTLMSDEEAARQLPVFRLENMDIISSLELDSHRSGFTYSIDELSQHFQVLAEDAQNAAKVPAKERSLRQKKVVELANRIILYHFLEQSLGRPPLLPDTEQFGKGNPELRVKLFDRFAAVNREGLDEFMRENRAGPLPLMIPEHVGQDSSADLPQSVSSDWEVLSTAWVHHQFLNESGSSAAPAILHFGNMLNAARDGDAKQFNSELNDYRQLLNQHYAAIQSESKEARDDLPLAHVIAEARFNRSELFYNLAVYYVISMVVAFVGWILWPEFNQRLSFALSLGLLALYTYGICMRIYISGRPPVTNLYSSAIFIGWATVLGGLLMEGFTWKGFGNVVAAATGFGALLIANALSTDGDTIAVMEAVLDTQFWLATHVVCITLGYATTFLAGSVGLLYLIRGILTPVSAADLKRVSDIVYGTICFAMFFSFFGTVLGGLWADDSWGRFWGWDPKENGALIIVLWNAVILHARWDGLIKQRGMAVLAVLGNVVVSWSWFGVNELGVGLHSYGFTEGRLFWLAMFALSQIAVAIIGLAIPQAWWVCRRAEVASKLNVSNPA